MAVDKFGIKILGTDEEEQKYDKFGIPILTTPQQIYDSTKKNYEEKANAYNSLLANRQAELNDSGFKQVPKIEFNSKIPKIQNQKFIQYSPPKLTQEEINNNKKIVKEINDRYSHDVSNAINEKLYSEYLYNVARVNNEENNLLTNTIGMFPRLIGDIGSSITLENRKYIDENGNKVYLPTYSQIKNEKVREDIKSPFWRFLYDAGYNTGKIALTSAINSIPGMQGFGSAIYWQDMFMDNYTNSINQGYDEKSALMYSAISTGSEAIIGKLLGSATKKLLGGKTNQFTKTLNDKVFSKFIKNPKIANIFANGTSEATEEFFQEYFDNINRLVTLEKKDLGSIFKDITNTDIFVDALYSAGIGAISGGTLEGINTIGKVYVLDNFKMQLQETRKNTTDTAKIAEIDNLINRIDEVKSNPNLQEDLNQEINRYNNNNVEDSINNNLLKSNEKKYQYLETNNQKINTLYQSASQYFNNSKETQNMLDTISKIIKDKNYNVVFDDSIGNNVNGKIETVNGEVAIRINPKSPRAIEFILTHEITHAIETAELNNLVINFAKKNPDFNNSLTKLMQTYNTREITSEVVADISGQLLGNQEFINSLTMENTVEARNFIQKVYDAIVRLKNKLTKEGRYQNFLDDLESKWRKAYQTQENNLNDSINYSKGKLNNGENVVISDDINSSHPQKNDVKQTLQKMLGIKYINESSSNEISIENKDISKYLNDGYNNFKNMQLKKRIAGNYGEVIEISKIDINASKSNYKGTNRGKQGYDYYNVNLAYPIRSNNGKIIDHKIYEARLVVRKDNNNNFAYDLDNFKQKKGTALDKSSLSIVADKTADSSFNEDNISQKYTTVKSDTSSIKYSMQENDNNTRELDNSSFSLKQKQNDIIQKNNPVADNYHTWIRSVDDIKTFAETLQDSDYKEYYEAEENFDDSYTAEMAKKALETGKITVYSSYPIKQGIFVSPSKMEAESYSGNGKVYSKEVNLTDVAWIDPTQGQYAKVLSNSKYSLNSTIKTLEQRVSGDKLLDAQDLINDIKEVGAKVDDNGYVTVYHQTTESNAKRIIETGKMTAKEPAVFFSTSKNAQQADGRGQIKLEFKIPVEKLVLDDLFSDNADVKIPLKNYMTDSLDVSDYLVNNKNSNQNTSWQEHLEKNYKATGTRTYAKDIVVENNSNLDYNKTEVSANELDGRRIGRVSRISEEQKENLGIKNESQQKSRGRREFQEFINKAETRKATKHTEKQQSIINDYKTRYEIDVVFFDGDNSDYGGGVDLSNNNKVYIDVNDAKVYGESFIAGHELMESMILRDNDFKNNEIKQLKKKIINDENFNKIRDFYQGNYSDSMIAKEVICDTFSSVLNNDLTKIKYTKELNFKLRNEIKNVTLKEYNKVYGNKSSIKTSDYVLQSKDVSSKKEMKETNLLKKNKYTKIDLDNMNTYVDNKGRELKLPNELGVKIAENTNIGADEIGGLQRVINNSNNIEDNNSTLKITSDYDNNIYEITAIKQGDLYIIDNITKKSNNGLESIADKQKKAYQEVVDNFDDMKESKFYKNVTETSEFITKENQKKLATESEINFYKEVSNEQSLNNAKQRLDKGGNAEVSRWFDQNDNMADSTDVAEGWVLLKRYQDAGDYDSMVVVAKKMRRIGTAAGQAIQAYNIMARLTPEGMVRYAQSELTDAYNVYVKNKPKSWIDENQERFDLTPDEVKYIVDTMKDVQKTTNERTKKIKLAEIQAMLGNKLPPAKGDGIKAWMRISMLFNPKTQVRNIMGNAIIAPMNTIGDFVASKVDKLIAKKTGVRTTGSTDIKSYFKGFKKGLFESYDDFKRGINTRNINGNRFEVNNTKSFNDNSKLGKSLNKVDNLLSFMLDAGDRGFYEASFVNSINNQMILNNTTNVTQTMIDIATQEALSRTWQDNNNYTKFVLDIRKNLNKINVKGYGLGDVLIPFAKTPANLTKAIVDYSPVGMVNAITQGINLKNSLSNGQYNAKMQHQFVQTLGKATAGTMLYVLGYALAKTGHLTGKSDDDKDVQDFMKNTLGISSYSIKIGNKSFTYDWAQPIAAPLSIMANINSSKNKSKALYEAIIANLDTAGSVLLEQSFLESINDALSNNDGVVSGIFNEIMELPSRAVPTFSKQITDMIDGTQRTTYEYDKPVKSALNTIKNRIPGLSQTLQPKIDTLGREVKKYGGKNNIFNVFLNPANVNTENISDSAKEIYKVYKQTGDKTILPRVAPYYINTKGEKVLLKASEKTEFQKISGQIIENNVKELISNENYKNMSYEDKSVVIKNIVDYAYNYARKKVLDIDMSNTYNKINEWTENGGKVYEYYSNKEENNFALSNPNKYSTLINFNIKYDDYIKYKDRVDEIKDLYSGNNNTNVRKKKITEYIETLNLNKYQKIMLYKELGGYSITYYKQLMYQYINNLKLSKENKEIIWYQLYK